MLFAISSVRNSCWYSSIADMLTKSVVSKVWTQDQAVERWFSLLRCWKCLPACQTECSRLGFRTCKMPDTGYHDYPTYQLRTTANGDGVNSVNRPRQHQHNNAEKHVVFFPTDTPQGGQESPQHQEQTVSALKLGSSLCHRGCQGHLPGFLRRVQKLVLLLAFKRCDLEFK